jgi:hypothetical protein
MHEENENFKEMKIYFQNKENKKITNTGDEQFLGWLLSVVDDEQFLSEAFQDANTSHKNEPYWITLLDRLAFYPYDPEPKWQNFEIYFSVVKTLIDRLPNEILNNKASPLGMKFLGEFTVLSLSIKYFLKLYEQRFKSMDSSQHLVYKNICQRLKEELIEPLMARGSDPNIGSCLSSDTVLVACLKLYLTPDLDPIISSLTETVLNKTDNINAPGRLGLTAIAVAVLREFPEEIIRSLVARGADVNVCFTTDPFLKARQPLLCHMIKKQDYGMQKLLLELGADPNLIPVVDPGTFQKDKDTESWLSPFQLAVARNDEQAILLINDATFIRGIELQPELTEFEKQRGHERCLNKELKYYGDELFLQCTNRMFTAPNFLLTEIHQKYSIRCFVRDLNYKEMTKDAISWLFERAPTSCAAKFWNIAASFLTNAMQQNARCAIFVSPSVGELSKTCYGRYCNDQIHIGSNLLKEILDIKCLEGSEANGLIKHLVAAFLTHEIGHLVDHSTFKFNSIGSSLREQNLLFNSFLAADLKNLDLNSFTGFLRFRLATFEEAYEGRRVHEYFAFLFFELPIHFAFENPKATESDLLEFMGRNFPKTLKWFLSNEAYLIQQGNSIEIETNLQASY